ncbi:MAG: transposase family protein [Fuerstiella sp.]
MDSISRHYHQMVGLNDDWGIDSVDLDVAAQTLKLQLEFVGAKVACPDCGNQCSRKDKAPERSWRHLDAMQFQTVLTARVPRAECDACGVKTISVPWAGKHNRFTLMFEAFAIDVLHASRSVDAASALLGIHWSTAQKLIERAVERGLARRSTDEVLHAGVDEKSFGKGQDHVTVFDGPRWRTSSRSGRRQNDRSVRSSPELPDRTAEKGRQSSQHGHVAGV